MSGWDDELDGLLAQARATPALPSEVLIARVMADARAMQGGAVVAHAPAVALTARPGFWAVLTGALGGGGALAGISMATLAGVFLGVTQPAPVAAFTQTYLTGTALDLVDLLPADDALWAEE